MRTYFKQLTDSDVSARLSIPMECLKEALGCPRDGAKLWLEAIDNSDPQKKWKFRLTTRKGRYPMPILTMGWLAYVREKRLQAGDRVVLQVEEDGRFRIQAQREVPFKLFGTEIEEANKIWTDVETLQP